MLGNEEGHYGIERVYSDPSAAHERALQFRARGAYRVVISPLDGMPRRYCVVAWFTTLAEATAALG